MCNSKECGAKSDSTPAQSAVRLNRAPLSISTKGPNSVKLNGKNHALYLVEDGFVTAMSGSVVIIKKGKVIANANSTVMHYPGVEIVKAHKTAVIFAMSAA